MTDISKISIITVAYQSAVPLAKMLKTIPDGPEIIVVDNGEDDGFRAVAAQLGVKLIVAPKNLGFGGACNLGAKAATGDFFLFLNPDTQCYPDTLEQFLKAVARHPEASAFGASLESENGWVRYRRENHLTPYAISDPRPNPETDTEVQMLEGSALMVRRAAFEAIGGFDANIFLYFEDDDISLRLRQEIGPIMYLPNARVVHSGGNSSPESGRHTRLKGFHWQRSHVYGLQKHGMTFARTKVFTFSLRDLLSENSIRSNEWRQMAVGRILGVLGLYRVK